MFQPGNKPLAIRSLMMVAFCATLFSFSDKMGSDSFTIYLNNELILQQHVTPGASVKSFSLNKDADNDVLKIYYSHCGKTGIGRSIAIRDDQNKVLKTWYFDDQVSTVITCKVKDILALSKNTGDKKLHLVYSSKEIPNGKLLAAINVSNEHKASLN